MRSPCLARGEGSGVGDGHSPFPVRPATLRAMADPAPLATDAHVSLNAPAQGSSHRIERAENAWSAQHDPRHAFIDIGGRP
jgi:hypothetical protein